MPPICFLCLVSLLSFDNNVYLRISMSVLRNFICCFSLLSALVVCLGCGAGVHDDYRTSALFTEMRYKSIDSVAVVASGLLHSGAEEDKMTALNALGYSALMKMDYSEAERLYKQVVLGSRCEIERLVADVGLMTLCYRVSANREFFDYRTEALHCINRITEEEAWLPAHERERFERAKAEFAVVSICYFSNIGLQEECRGAAEFLSQEMENFDDTGLRIYARMILAGLEPDALKRLEAYVVGASVAERYGYTWLLANYRLLMAINLRSVPLQKSMQYDIPAVVRPFVADDASPDVLALEQARSAVDGFENYGDTYMKVEALAVVASCLTQMGDYEGAIAVLDTALCDVNTYYERVNPSFAPLALDSVYFDIDSEMPALYNDSVKNVWECLLSIRREASCAYAGLGNKYLSDINREAYLELLRSTRMNRQMESRVQIATDSAVRLYWGVLFVVLVLLGLTGVLFVVVRRSRRRDAVYSQNLKLTLALCRRLMSSLPAEMSSEEEVCNAVCGIVKQVLAGFSGKVDFSLLAPFEVCDERPFVYKFPLPLVGGARLYTLYMVATEECSEDKLSLINIALPYIAVAVEEGLRIANLSDEQLRVDEQRMAHALYLAEHKRENVLKRVSVSVLHGMRPYIDRIMNELRSLRGSDADDVVERRLHYVAELTEILDDFNVILERWIKMRSGELCLQVERFSVREVFDIIAKSKPLFDSRGIKLDIKTADAVVKADKALTLFMINTLVDNAGKFTPQGGRVAVEAVEHDEYVEIAVEDSGIGLSQDDIEHILHEKVYDASLIGKENGKYNANKGGGFGLMNCKGIIEKYRKTDSLFSVCEMNISSVKGEGSRFSFRLPKGVARCIVLLLSLFLPSTIGAVDTLTRVGAYADSVFLCNVNGKHDSAYYYASKAIAGLNDFYKENVGGCDTLSLVDGVASEIEWWRSALFPPALNEDIFFNILDVRNELAVAALATRNWHDYRYNNNIYASLYRLVHEDKGLEKHYEQMQQLANHRRAAVALLIFLLLVLVLVYVVYYVRHSVIERMNSRMVLELNGRLLAVTGGDERLSGEELAQRVASEIYMAVAAPMCIDRVSVLLKNADGESIVHLPDEEKGVLAVYMHSVTESGEAFFADNELLYVLPLCVVQQGEELCIGAVGLVSERPLSENEVMNIELIVRYVASVAYHSMVRMAEHYRELAMVEEEAERVMFEENRLHVQNMVMDNCLSMIKHETIYYPGRVRALVEQSVATGAGERATLVDAMRELMDYYNSVFSTLGNCAVKQLDDMSFKQTDIALEELFAEVRMFVARKAKRASVALGLTCEPTALSVCGDRDLLLFLFESLVTAFMGYGDGNLLLRAVDCGDAVRVELVDVRRCINKELLQCLFVPSKDNLAKEGLRGMEFLVVKEIVRLHEDCLQKHGLRVVAEDRDEGTVIMFTLLKAVSDE